MGWGHQIANGGEPTARIGVEYEKESWPSFKPSRPAWTPHVELTWSSSGEAGYYTDAGVGLRTRVGLFDSHFYEFASTPLAGQSKAGVSAQRLRGELFLFSGIRGRGVVYNALLQGQLRSSDYVIAAKDIRRGFMEGEYGMSFLLRYGDHRSHGIRGTYVLRAFRGTQFEGKYATGHDWGAVFVSFH